MKSSHSQGRHRQIKQKQIDQLLQLQQLFHSKFLTADLLNQLIATYVEAIQCFDAQYSPMRKYFLQKIQFVVSRPQVDAILKRNTQNDNAAMGMLRQTIRLTTNIMKPQDVFSQQRLLEAIENQNKISRQKMQKQKELNKTTNTNNFSKNNSNKLNQSQKSQSNNHFYLSSPQKSPQQQQHPSSNSQNLHTTHPNQQQKFKDRHNKIQMQMKVMRQIQQNMKNINIQVEQQDIKFIKKQKRINKLMQQQNLSLQQRLAKRKKAKNKKKSNDQKQMKQIKQMGIVIDKQQLKQAQKQIEQAIVRMTIRLTQRTNTQGTKGMTGLMIAPSLNVNGLLGSRNTGGSNTAKRLQEQKIKGRIKMKNIVKQQDQQDEDLLAGDYDNNNSNSNSNSNKVNNTQNFNSSTQTSQQTKITESTNSNSPKKNQLLDNNKQQQTRQQQSGGTGRFTLGTQNRKTGRITMKRKEKNQNDEEEEEFY